MHLPHEKHICKWNSSVNCEPGFLSDVIELLGKRAKCDKILQDVVLIIDAMAIRKGTWWDEKKNTYVGNVDYGTALIEQDDNLATEALVFLLSGVSGHWKFPVAYFLQHKNSGQVLARLIKDCLKLLYTQGLHTVAIVFDGTNANKCTATYLGCDMSTDNIQSWFLHPSDENVKGIYHL